MEFNRRILASIVMIALLSVFVGAGTMAFFSDTEKVVAGSKPLLTMGILDISLDTVSKFKVENMMPCETATITYTVRNIISTVPVKVFVRITDIATSGGANPKPEKVEEAVYGVHDYLPPWIIYDLRTVGVKDVVLASQEIRLDNVQNYWIYVGQIPVQGSLVLEHSFHLKSWTDSPMEITNWAQGDRVSFDIEVYATQVDAPAPKVTTLTLLEKDAKWWEPIQGGKTGTLDIDAKTFKATGLVAGTDYELIYYADPWDSTGGKSLGTGIVAGDGSLTISVTGLSGIPVSTDRNYPVGGKIWLVLDADYDEDAGKMIAWSPSSYLFEEHLIKVP